MKWGESSGTNTYTRDEIDALIASIDGQCTVEKTSNPIFGLVWNVTDDAYVRIGININKDMVDGNNEFTSFLSPTATRQNDNDSFIVTSNLTQWLDGTPNLPFSSIKRYVIDNTGAEVKEYNADSYTHADQTGILNTQQIMTKIPKFYYVQAKIVDSGKTYHLYLIANSLFTIDLIADLKFINPTITCWNPTSGISSGTVNGSVITSAIHPAFIDANDTVLDQRYYGSFNAVSGRSICGSGIKATGTITRATARTSAVAFGGGFALIDFFLRSAVVLLALVERGTWYMDVGKWRGYSWNNSASSYDQYNGVTLPLLNKTGVILNSSSQVIANSYRGVENYHGALWNFIDGVNSSNYSIYLAKPKATFTDDTTASPYFDSEYDVPSGASAMYISDFSAGSFIPSAVGATATTKATDGCWSATGNTTLIVGGALNHGALSGLSAWNSNNASSNANWNIVGRPILYRTFSVCSCVSLALAKTHDYLLLCAGRLCRTLKEDISL